MLGCEAAGKPKPVVIWRKDGTTIKQGKSKVELYMYPVNYKNAGNYECLAVNRGGTDERKVTFIVKRKYGTAECSKSDLFPQMETAILGPEIQHMWSTMEDALFLQWPSIVLERLHQQNDFWYPI